MHQTNIKALNLDSIYTQLIPYTEGGKALKRKSLHGTTPGANEVHVQYQRIAILLKSLQENAGLRAEICDYLGHIPAITSPSTERDLEVHDLFELKQFIHFYHKIRSIYEQAHLRSLYTLPDLSSVYALLDPDDLKMPVFQLSPTYSKTLAAALASLHQTSLALRHEEALHLSNARKELQLPNLKPLLLLSRMQDKLIAQLSQTPFYHISAENMANVTFTLSNNKAIRSLKLKNTRLREKLQLAEAAVLQRLNRQLRKHSPAITTAIMAIDNIDWDFARADFGLRYGCTIPQITKKQDICLTAAVNLHLKWHLEASSRHLQPLDIDLSTHISILTGPNMGGKTTALKTVGQLCQMAMHAIPLPCRTATLPVFDFVWYNQDDESDSADLSSFGRETVSLNAALKHRGTGLLLLDEFGKGTNPSEGEALSTAVLRYLQTTSHKCFTATHFTAPTRLPRIAQYAIIGFSDGVFASLENTSDLRLRLQILNEAMDYGIIRLHTHQAPPQCAVKIAEVLGLHPDILKYLL